MFLSWYEPKGPKKIFTASTLWGCMCSSRASERDKHLNQSSPSARNLAETTLSFWKVLTQPNPPRKMITGRSRGTGLILEQVGEKTPDSGAWPGGSHPGLPHQFQDLMTLGTNTLCSSAKPRLIISSGFWKFLEGLGMILCVHLGHLNEINV